MYIYIVYTTSNNIALVVLVKHSLIYYIILYLIAK